MKICVNHTSNNGLITTVYKASRGTIKENKNLNKKMYSLVETDLTIP